MLTFSPNGDTIKMLFMKTWQDINGGEYDAGTDCGRQQLNARWAYNDA